MSYSWLRCDFFNKLLQTSMDPKKVLELKNKLRKDREVAYEKNEKYKREKQEEKIEQRRLSRKSKEKLFPYSKIPLESNKNRLLVTEEKFSQRNSGINEYDSNNKQQKIRNMVLKEDTNHTEPTDKIRNETSKKQNTETTKADISNTKGKNTKEDIKIKKTDVNNQTNVNNVVTKTVKTKPKIKMQKTKLQEKSTKRVQKFRAKMTDEKREEQRRKYRDRYKKLKMEGRLKSIKDHISYHTTIKILSRRETQVWLMFHLHVPNICINGRCQMWQLE